MINYLTDESDVTLTTLGGDDLIVDEQPDPQPVRGHGNGKGKGKGGSKYVSY